MPDEYHNEETAMNRSLLLFPLCILLLAGCGPKDSGTAGTKSQTPASPATPSGGTPPSSTAPPPANKDADKPDVKLTSEQFLAESKQDGNVLGKKYSDKTIEMTGEMVSGGRAPSGGPVLILKGDGKDTTNCWINAKGSPYSLATPGQTVTLRIKYGTTDLWDVVSVTGKGLQQFTLDDIAKEFKDADAAKAKHKDKKLIVTGEITEVKVEGSTVLAAYIGKAGDPHRVRLGFAPGDPKEIRDHLMKVCKPGQKVTAIGDFSDSSPKQTDLMFCAVFDPPM